MVESVRVTLSGPEVPGGQRIKTLRATPLSFDQLVGALCQHLDLDALCRQHGFERASLAVQQGPLHVVGLDGPRRVLIRDDEALKGFWLDLRHSRMPTLDCQLPPLAAATAERALVVHTGGGGAQPGAAASGGGAPGAAAPDQLEQLEDENYKLQTAAQKLGRRLDEMDRLRAADREETERLVSTTRRELKGSQEEDVKKLRSQIKVLQEGNAGLLKETEALSKRIAAVERSLKAAHEELLAGINELSVRVQGQFEDVGLDIAGLRDEDGKLAAEDARLADLIAGHGERLQHLATTKVDVSAFLDSEKEHGARLGSEIVALIQRVTHAEEAFVTGLGEARAELSEGDRKLAVSLEESVASLRSTDEQLQQALDSAVAEANKQLEATREELEEKIDTDVRTLSESTGSRFSSTVADLNQKDQAVHEKVDELSQRSQASFGELDERLEEMVRVERARLNGIEKDLADGNTRLRCDFRAEMERVRSDYEQEAARLDGDLSDLHMKHDVTKQEIGFFQSRLLEQRDWAQRQLVEAATATRAAQVDSQEGVAAATKMLYAMRDDQVAFREKMAKHVSMLQHSADSHGDAIVTLETQRARARLDLDNLMEDHKAYTEDMDGWADDVRVKVERLFRAMEPGKAEWRVHRPLQRDKELKRPLALKSEPFSLQGLTSVQMEFFPNGHQNTPEGHCALRLLMPPGSRVRYQVYVGRLTEGSKDFDSRGSSALSVDCFFGDWRSEVAGDGTLCITLEVLQDLSSVDGSLARQLHLENL